MKYVDYDCLFTHSFASVNSQQSEHLRSWIKLSVATQAVFSHSRVEESR